MYKNWERRRGRTSGEAKELRRRSGERGRYSRSQGEAGLNLKVSWARLGYSF